MLLLAFVLELSLVLASLLIEQVEELALLHQQRDVRFDMLERCLTLFVGHSRNWERGLTSNCAKGVRNVGSIDWHGIPSASCEQISLQPFLEGRLVS